MASPLDDALRSIFRVQPRQSETERSPRRARPTRTEFQGLALGIPSWVGAGVLCLGGAAAALSGLQPTGLAIWDVGLVFAAASFSSLLLLRAPHGAIVWLSAVAAGCSGTGLWIGIGWICLALAISDAAGRGGRLVRPAVVSSAILTLVHIPSYGFVGLPSILAVVGIGPPLLVAFGSLKRELRRRLAVTGLALVTLTLLLGGLGIVALLDARVDVERGIGAARVSLEAARSGEIGDLSAGVDEAAAALESAEGKLTSWRTWGLPLIPIAAQNYDAVRAATSVGADVLDQASGAQDAAGLRDLELRVGSIDLQAIDAASDDFADVVSVLDRSIAELSGLDNPWLLPVLERRIGSLVEEVEGLLPDVRTAAAAADVVPDALGLLAARNYFVIFGTPAESRELGGFFGSWGLVRFDGGAPSLLESGRYQQLIPFARESGYDDSQISEWFVQIARVTTFPQNVTSSPDMRTVAAVTRDLFAAAFDDPIDGLIYVDQWALIDLLGLAGEIYVPDRDEPITPQNAEDYFFREQYEFVGADRNELFDGLAASAAAVLTEFENQDLPGPEELGRLLGPAARAGRLQIVTFNEKENEFFERIHLLRSFDDAGTTTDDFVGLIQSNATASKLDLYLNREIEYVVQRQEDGAATAAVTVRLAGDVPADAPRYTTGWEAKGTNRVLLSIYTLGELTEMRVNSQVVDPISGPDHGKWRHLVGVDVPPDGEVQTIEYELALDLDPGEPYSLEMWQQPLVNNDTVTVTYRGPDGNIDWTGELVEDLFFRTTEDGGQTVHGR